VLAARETQERVLQDARTTVLTAGLAVTGFVLTLVALQNDGLGNDATVVAVLALAAFVAEVFGGRLTPRIEVSASGFLAILAAVIAGPAAAALTGLRGHRRAARPAREVDRLLRPVRHRGRRRRLRRAR